MSDRGRSSTGSASFDVMFDVLRKPPRRRILHAVSTSGACGTDGITPGPLAEGSEEGRASRVELLHVHLPKLAESGYVRWDSDAEVVRRGPNFDDIAPLLRLLAEHDDELPDDWP